MAQVIPIAALPVLTRLVPAPQLGTYFVWFGAVSVLTVVATGRLDMAVFAARSFEEVTQLLVAVMAFGITVAIVALAGSFGFEALMSRPLLAAGANDFILAWVVVAMLMAANQCLLAVYIYKADFRSVAIIKISLAGAVSLAQLFACWWFPVGASLVYAQLAATAIVVIALVFRFVSDKSNDFHPPQPLLIGGTLKQNYRFPVFAMPADFVNTYAAQLPLFLIAARFGAASVAFYALTLRVLAAPIGLLAGSVLTVFKENAGRDYRDLGNCLESYRHTLRSLAAMAAVPAVVLFFLGEELFVFVFGREWLEAGQFAELLAPMFFMRFVASPLSYTLYIANQQVQDLLWQLVLLGMTWAVFRHSGSLKFAVLMYSVGYSILYVFYILMSYRAARGNKP